MSEFESIGYVTPSRTFVSSRYGVPQPRDRIYGICINVAAVADRVLLHGFMLGSARLSSPGPDHISY